jgi:glycosyltransferase involved in cell wall biosynthesis
MRIVVDLQSCQSGSRLGGIGRYSIELLKAILRLNTNHEFIILISNLMPDTEISIRNELADYLPQSQIRTFDSIANIHHYKNNKTKIKAAELIREDFLKSLNADVVHITSLFEGLHEEVITSVADFYPKEKTVVTLYDLIPFAMKEKYLVDEHNRKHYEIKIKELKQAGFLLAISEFSRQQGIALLELNPDNIVNISSAADKKFKKINFTTNNEQEIKAKYNIHDKFLMYTGSFDQRKNHVRLIEGFARIAQDNRFGYQLLIVGNGWEGVYQELKLVAEKSGLNKDEVIFAGHIDDNDLVLLYNICDCFIFPSLAEGFGLPVLEAMSCGTPVLCSNCTSLPEVVEFERALFDPRDVKSISKKIEEFINDPELREELKEHVLEQSKKFSWEKSAKITLNIYEQIHEREASRSLEYNFIDFEEVSSKISEINKIELLPDEAILDISESIFNNRIQAQFFNNELHNTGSDKNIALMTTWNSRCGIATYSEDTFRHFPKIPYILAPNNEQIENSDTDNVIRCWDFESDLQDVIKSVKKYNIDILYIQFQYGFFNFRYFQDFLIALHNLSIRVVIIFHNTQDPCNEKQLVTLKYQLEKCLQLIVHSQKDILRLQSLGLKSNLSYLPHGINVPSNTEKHNLDTKDAKLIAVYGFALPQKGLVEVVQAISILNRKTSGKYSLLMLNAEHGHPVSREVIENIKCTVIELSLGDCVDLITDFLPYETSISHLQNADLILYPYQYSSESASGAVRIGLATKRPVAVTPLEIFSDMSNKVFYLPGTTPQEIAEGIETIINVLESMPFFQTDVFNAASLWIKSNAYQAIASQMLWLGIRPVREKYNYYIEPLFDISNDSPVLVFEACSEKLKTIVGVKDKGRIFTSGNSGNLLHGPFVSIGAGFYKVIIYGGSDVIAPYSFDVDIASNCGGSILAAKNILNIDIRVGIIAELEFEIPKFGMNDLEVRINVLDRNNFWISNINISPL